ncbi:MAG: thioredoxin family protein [Polyangiaceae bacterium]|nr:thioredoxin family protein [Polyangiaceae bacterium]
MVRPLVHATFAAVLLNLAACSKEAPHVTNDPAARSQTKDTARIEWIKAPAGEDAAAVVKRELERAHADKKTLLVYVGATWCEPCTRFHEAAERGELDGVFPNLRLVEFDLDVDAERLAKAGYASKMIPLFAVPSENGTSSSKHIEGSIKGEGAVMNLRNRLKPLIDTATSR